VVVGRHDERERRVRGLQVAVGLVLRVAHAVVVERDGLAADVAAHQHLRHRERRGAPAALVHVVAGVQDEVEVLAREVGVRRVEPLLVVLAADHPEAQQLRGRTGRGHRAGATDRRLLAGDAEAVPPPAVRLEPGQLDVHAVRDVRRRRHRARPHDLRERLVGRELPVDVDGCGGHAAVGVERRRGEARPQHHAVRGRVARRDAEREQVGRQRLRGAGPAGRGRGDEHAPGHGERVAEEGAAAEGVRGHG
jgi:hypothetical protein